MKDKIIEILKKCELNNEDIFCDNYSKNDAFDSLTVFEIIMQIEEKFNIEINGEDIVEENLQNLDTITALVEKYL